MKTSELETHGRIKTWHNNLSHRAKLFYYGVLGNTALSLMDTAASLAGGKGSVVNLLHNSGDVASYGLRFLVASCQATIFCNNLSLVSGADLRLAA